MHDSSLMLARPEASDQLVLLLHGVGSSAQGLAPVGQALAKARPRASVVSVEAPHPSQLGQGKEWFSVVGISEENRPQRIAQAMPPFLRAIQHWQSVTDIGPDRTVLVGFSQGAIMSLESTQVAGAPSANRLIAIAGRFAQAPRSAPRYTQVHLLHGEQDAVMPVALVVAAEQQLHALGARVTLDRFSGLGHGIDGRVAETVLRLLV